MTLINPELPPTPPVIAPTYKRMLEVEHKNDGTHVYINSSSLSMMQSCPRKAELGLFRGLRATSQSPALTFGTAIHKALEVFYAAPREARVFPKAFDEMKRDFELMAFGSALSDQHAVHSNVFYGAVKAFIKAAQPLVDVPPQDKRSISNGVWILAHYFDTYKDDPYTIVCDDDGPMVERSLEMKLHTEAGLTIHIHGQIDAVLMNEAQGQVCPTDHKTSSMMGKDFYNRLKPNHQYSCYILLAQEVLGIDRDIFIVNGVEVKAKPKTSRGSPPKFIRQITRRDEHDIKDFKEAVVYWTHQYLEWCEKGYFPMGHVDSCAMYGGCTYHRICAAPHVIKENIIDADFKGALDAKS